MVKVLDQYEERELKYLTAQMKQSVKEKLLNAIKGLAIRKKNGFKIGKLKFKSEIKSIPLRQFNCDFHIKGNKIKIAKLDQLLRVKGLDQIPQEAEIANAHLIRKCNNFYINITTFQPRTTKKARPNTAVGIDFGCETQLALDNGIKIVTIVEPTSRLKRLDRKISKKTNKTKKDKKVVKVKREKGQKRKNNQRAKSKNKYKDQCKRKVEHNYIKNKRKDIRNKIVNAITNVYQIVCIQDESIHAWHSGNHGKKVQHSGIGGILADLKHKSVTPIVVDKFFPSTKLCPKCGTKKTLSLSDRIYDCDNINCDFVFDRDVKSAYCIKHEGLKQVPMECRDLCRENDAKLGEILTTTLYDTLKKIHGLVLSKSRSMSQEAAYFLE